MTNHNPSNCYSPICLICMAIAQGDAERRGDTPNTHKVVFDKETGKMRIVKE